MSEVYRLYNEPDYNATTKTTGAGQAQEWDAAKSIGGLNGYIKNTIVTTIPVFATATHAEINSNFMTIQVYYDFSQLTYPNNISLECINVYSTTGFLSRFGFQKNGSQYQWRMGQYKDARAGSVFTAYNVSGPGPDYLEMLYSRPSTHTSLDGTVHYATGLAGDIGTPTGLDNYDEFPLFSKIAVGGGLLAGSINAGFTGDFWIGKVIVTNDDTPIGPYVLHNRQVFNQLRRRRRLSL